MPLDIIATLVHLARRLRESGTKGMRATMRNLDRRRREARDLSKDFYNLATAHKSGRAMMYEMLRRND